MVTFSCTYLANLHARHSLYDCGDVITVLYYSVAQHVRAFHFPQFLK